MHVIFLEPGFPANQRQFVRALRQAGALVSGVGDRPASALDPELRGWLHQYMHVPSTANDEAVTAAVQELQRRGPWVDRLECTVEALMLTAARVRERTAIPGMTVRQTLICRDKVLMKEFLRERGIPCARTARVHDLAQARAFADEVGWPIILKPLAAAGAAGTWRVDDPQSLARVCVEAGVSEARPAAVEEFVTGHEGFFDTLVCNGRVVFEAICHYYPNVLEAMRVRDPSPLLMVTNRIDAPGYREVKALGHRVIRELGLETATTHMEWFFGARGLYFSEIGARPPGVRVWDLYCLANDMDLYRHWADAVVHGACAPRPSRRYAAGMVSIRPNRDGRVTGYSGVDEVMRRHGDAIVQAHLPPPGTRTNDVGSGYMGNAWVWARHPDYDACRAILDDVGRTLRMWAE